MYSTVQYGTVRNRVYLLRRKLMIRQSGIGICCDHGFGRQIVPIANLRSGRVDYSYWQVGVRKDRRCHRGLARLLGTRGGWAAD